MIKCTCTIPSLTLFEFPFCCLQSIYINKDEPHLYTNIVCVCVFFPSILDIKFVGRTSRGHTGGRSHRIFNPPSFCGACLDFCREKDSAIPFLVDREVEFCVLTN